jgi:hypothetical protein
MHRSFDYVVAYAPTPLRMTRDKQCFMKQQFSPAVWSEATKTQAATRRLENFFQMAESLGGKKEHAEQRAVVSHVDQNAGGD